MPMTTPRAALPLRIVLPYNCIGLPCFHMGAQTIVPGHEPERVAIGEAVEGGKPLPRPLVPPPGALRAVPHLNVAPLEVLGHEGRPRTAGDGGVADEEHACLVRRIARSLAPIDDAKYARDSFPSREAAVGDDAADIDMPRRRRDAGRTSTLYRYPIQLY